MSGTGRIVATGVATVGVVLTGGIAVAASLGSAHAAAPSNDPSIAALQDRLAQLQSDTVRLTGEVTAASTALRHAESGRAARAAAAAKAARSAASAAAAAAVTRPPVRPAAPVRTAAPAPQSRPAAPATHTSTGASGAASGTSGEHETEGGSDD
ncbi:MAG TPA: hypothetical protein VIJ41_11290 [Candidatus Nanopelagicales bacterium]